MRREMLRKMVLPKESFLAYSTFVRLHARMPHLKDKWVKWVKCSQISAVNVRARHPKMTSSCDFALTCNSIQHRDKSTIDEEKIFNRENKIVLFHRINYFKHLSFIVPIVIYFSSLSLFIIFICMSK